VLACILPLLLKTYLLFPFFRKKVKLNKRCSFKMNKNSLKYFVDIVMFIDFCSLTMTGFFLGFILPAGRGVNKYFLGMHRHEWANIHLYFSLLFLLLFFLHLSLNWPWIVNTTRRYVNEKRTPFVLSILAGLFVVYLTAQLAIQNYYQPSPF